MEDRWLTVDDICKYLSITKDTVYKWIEQKGMPASKIGRKWLFRKEDIDHWVKSKSSIDEK
jgi:excisionase family DNA binding protein